MRVSQSLNFPAYRCMRHRLHVPVDRQPAVSVNYYVDICIASYVCGQVMTESAVGFVTILGGL